MKIRCLANTLTDEQKIELGIDLNVKGQYRITPGNVYTVLGIRFILGTTYQNGVIFEIKDDLGYIASISSCLFEVEDTRSSSFWRAKIDGTALLLWPKEFYTRYFHDDLTDGVPEVVKLFDRVVDRMENEFD